MKKSLSVVLCVLLSVICLTCSAESKPEYTALFDTPITSKAASEMGYNARTWLANETSRAIFNCMLLWDYGNAIDQKVIEVPPFDMNITDNVSYIGRDGITIYLMILSQDKKQGLIYMYKDSSSGAGCFSFDCGSQSAAEYALRELCPDGVYKIDPADLHQVSTSIMNALDE